MTERSLTHIVSLAATLRDDGISRTGQHDRGIEILISQYVRRLVYQKIICRDINVESRSPLFVGDLAVFRRGEKRGCIDHDVQPAVRSNQFPQTLPDGIAAPNVHGNGQAALLARTRLCFLRYSFCGIIISIGNHHMRPALSRQQSSFASNPAAATYN